MRCLHSWLLSCLGMAAAGPARWEWAGAFPLVANEMYTWSAVRASEGAYADPDMRLLVLQMTGDLPSMEASAWEHWNRPAGDWRNMTMGDLTRLGVSAPLRLIFSDATWASLFLLQPEVSGNFAFFTQHFPYEFENEFHFLRNRRGENIEPVEESPGAADNTGRIWLAVGCAAITSLPSLVFVTFIGPGAAKLSKRMCSVVDSFACGTLIAVTMFLLLPESFTLVNSGFDEVTRTWTWGGALVLGWLVGLFLHELLEIMKVASSGNPNAQEEEERAQAGAVVPAEADVAQAPEKPLPINWGLAGPILLGDVWHSLIDGMVIGFSAKVCSVSALWAVVGATLAHEAPQEIADYLLLITKANMGWKMATLMNFGTALPPSAIGAMVAYQVTIADSAQGICLAFGAGVFLFVALTELGHGVVSLSKDTWRLSISRFLSFIVGLVAIGVVLGSHEHCGPEHGHADHAHAH